MSRNRLAFTLLGAHAVSGCAREALPPEVPGMPERIASAVTASPAALELPHRPVRHGQRSLEIPDGTDCLAELRDAGIVFDALGETPGMQTPVGITGPIAGIHYESAGQPALVCDCRLAVALHWVGPELSALGVTRVRYSGAYVYRTQRNGRPSLHAAGLAIDLHELTLEDGRSRTSVEHDFLRGTSPSCSSDLPVVNRLACELGRTGLFEEVITPDDNSDHRDHVHVAIAPL